MIPETQRQKFTASKFWRVAAVILILVTLLNSVVGVIGIINDRSSLADREELHEEQEASRNMLDARARIQIAIIQSGIKRDVFAEDEKRLICENWDAAEYGGIERFCP